MFQVLTSWNMDDTPADVLPTLQYWFHATTFVEFFRGGQERKSPMAMVFHAYHAG